MLGNIKRLRLCMALGPCATPLQFALVIESCPQFGWQFAVDVVNIRQRKIGFEDRRPDRALDFADLLAVLAVINERFTDGFIAVDDDFGQLPSHWSGFFSKQRLSTGKVALVQIDNPAQTNLKR